MSIRALDRGVGAGVHGQQSYTLMATRPRDAASGCGDVCFSLLLLVGLLAAVLIKVGTICFTEVVLLT